MAEALPALEAQRKRDLEDWMDDKGIDVVVFPAAGDVGKADVDTNDESAGHALQNGVKYSNGNRAIRHMGVPTVSVTMGTMSKSGNMPVNLTFAGKHGQDVALLKYAYDFERQTRRRTSPPVTPALESDEISLRSDLHSRNSTSEHVLLEVSSAERVSETEIKVTGHVKASSPVTLQVTIDGKVVPSQNVEVQGDRWSVQAQFTRFQPPKAIYGGIGRVVDKVMVVVLAKSGGEVSGKLLLIPQKGAVQQEVE